MPNDYLNQVKLNGTVYDIKDTTSGYTTNTGTVTGVTAGTGLSGGTISTSGTISLDTTRAISTSDIDTGTDTTNKLVSAKTISDAIDNAISGIPTVDEKVKQTSINTNSNYPILLKKSANATEETNTVNATNLTSGTAISINPSTGDLNVVKINGQTVGSSPKFTDTNTTYTLSGALSSHKFTSTLTAGGSGSGTSTSDITLAAGNNITLTDDTSNRKITISATVPTVPVTDVQVNSTSILSNGVADLKTSTSHPYSSTNALATMGDIAAAGGGTVTSVRVQATSPVQSSQNTAQSATLDTTISLADGYGDTKNPYTSKTKNTVLAAPSTANGVPTFRALTDDDIPSGYLKESYTGSNFTAGISYVDDLDGSGPAFFTSNASGGYSTFATTPGTVALVSSGDGNDVDGQIVINSTGVNISGNSVNISDVATPTQNNDAANKKYVDDKITDLDSSITATSGQAISAITITDGKIISSSKIAVGETNQNAFSTIAIKQGSTTTNVSADTKTDTFTIEAGNGITLTADSANDKVTIAGSSSANDGKLKLQKNTGTAADLFSADQSGDSTLKWTTTSVGSASGWSAGTMASIDTSKFSGGSFTQGTDSFTANTPTVINTSKFSGGSYTQGTFNQGSFTQGTDSFTAATMSSSVGSTTTSVTSPTTMTISFTGGSFTQGTDSYTKPTHGTDSFTAAALQTGFYTAGSAASFTQGTDSFTAGKLNSGFYTAGTAPSLTVTSTTVVNDLSKV